MVFVRKETRATGCTNMMYLKCKFARLRREENVMLEMTVLFVILKKNANGSIKGFASTVRNVKINILNNLLA